MSRRPGAANAHADWKDAVAKADKRAEDGVAVGPHAEREDSEDSHSELDEESEDSHSELDEAAYAMAVAELPRPTSSLKLEQAAWHVRSQAKHRALRKAAPLPPPHGSGGPFYELPGDVLIRVLSDSIDSPKDYAHVSRTCLQFNDAAVTKGVLAAVVSVAPYERGGVATTMARQAQDQAVAAGKTAREKVASAGANAVTHDMEPGSMHLASMPTSKLVAHGVYDSPSQSTWSEGTYNAAGEEHGLCRFKYPDGTLYEGGMCKGERHGLGVEVFTDGERTCRFEGSWVKDKRHGRGLLINGDFFDAMLGSYKWGEPFGIHICLGVREGAASAGADVSEDVQFIFYGPEPKGKKPKAGADGYMRRSA